MPIDESTYSTSTARAVIDPTCGLIVTGASGWIGRTVVAHARSIGHTVVAAGRGFELGLQAPQARFDLHDDEAHIARALGPVLEAAPRWAIIHCAGLAHVRHETPHARELLQRVNVHGTAKLLAACSLVGVERFVYASSIAVYDWGSGKSKGPRTEMDPPDPRTTYGKSKLGGERKVMQSNLEWRVARLATVFGVGDMANFLRLAKAIKQRRFVMPGRGDQRKSCIDVDTVARLLVGLATIAAPTDRLLNLAIPETPTLAEISCRLAAACGVPPPLSVSMPLLRLAARSGDLCALLHLPAPLTTLDLNRLSASTWVDSSRAAAMFPDLATTRFADKMEQAANYYELC